MIATLAFKYRRFISSRLPILRKLLSTSDN
jgi:hypothetical protein